LAIDGRCAADLTLRHELERFEFARGYRDLFVCDNLNVDVQAPFGPFRLKEPVRGIAPALANLERKVETLRVRLAIPRSRHDPKILWVDHAKIVGDRITEVRPIPGNYFTQEAQRRIGELGASCIAFVVRDVSVHEAP
jgi:hypothetical protein